MMTDHPRPPPVPRVPPPPPSPTASPFRSPGQPHPPAPPLSPPSIPTTASSPTTEERAASDATSRAYTSPSPPPPSPRQSPCPPAEHVARTVLYSLNATLRDSGAMHASAQLSLLYAERVRLSIAAVAPRPPHALLGGGGALADAVAALADAGVLGARFDEPAVLAVVSYVPARIVVRSAGVLRPLEGGTVRYARDTVLNWGSTCGVGSERLSPADWVVVEDDFVMFP